MRKHVLGVSLALLAAMPAAASATERTIIVLDASGSMWGQIDGKAKLEIARDALSKVLKTVPAETELGLMAYGHREKGSCTDIQLIVPPAKGTEAAISSAVENMKFLGKTPLSAAVKQAAEDLKYTEEKSTVILITDGLETCQADPCALGKELEQSGVDFTAHVVGFGLTAEEGKQVACLAENTGGKYIQASDAGGLEEALKTTVVAPAPEPAPQPAPAPEPAALDKNLAPKAFLKEGGPAPTVDVLYEIFPTDAQGGKGERVDLNYNKQARFKLAPGDYVVVATARQMKQEQKISVTADKLSEPVFVFDAAELTIRARPSEGADIDKNAQIIVDYPGDGASTADYGEAKALVGAGETKVTVKLGVGEVSETFNLAAGDVVAKDIIVGVGVASPVAYYSEGGDKVDSTDVRFLVFKAHKKIDGTREQLDAQYGANRKVKLPPGDYVVVADLHQASAETPFSIKAGEAKDVNVVLNAGVVAIEAEGAEVIYILEAKKNIEGKQKQLRSDYRDKTQSTLPAGDFVAKIKYKADKQDVETPFTVKAGERVEVKVP